MRTRPASQSLSACRLNLLDVTFPCGRTVAARISVRLYNQFIPYPCLVTTVVLLRGYGTICPALSLDSSSSSYLLATTFHINAQAMNRHLTAPAILGSGEYRGGVFHPRRRSPRNLAALRALRITLLSAHVPAPPPKLPPRSCICTPVINSASMGMPRSSCSRADVLPGLERDRFRAFAESRLNNSFHI